ncbi:MAG: hypothetical protein AAF693_13685 [Bacteroidota bacterium]
MTDPIKLEHFRNLVSLATADGKIEDVERVALSKIAYDIGLPLDRLNVMLEHGDEYVYFIPQNKQDKEKQLCDMILLAFADGDLAKAEFELIHLVGSRLDYSPPEVDRFIEEFRQKST